MDAHAVDAVAVVPATVLPPGVRYSTLSTEAHEQNHLAVGYDEQRYLAVHPGYSLSPHVFGFRMAAAIALVFLEVLSLLLVLVSLFTPCYRIDNITYVSLDGGYGGYQSNSPGRAFSMIVSSLIVMIFLILFSCICPVVIAVCVPLDQHARVSEESFNRELLERRGAQVHEDGRVFSAGGVPSAWKQEGMLGPCCGFEANERSRLSRNAGIYGVQCAIECVSVILLSIILYDMMWVHRVAVLNLLSAKFMAGFYLVIAALVVKALEFLGYGFSAVRVLCIAPHRRMPRCQLVPLPSAASRAVELSARQSSGFDVNAGKKVEGSK